MEDKLKKYFKQYNVSLIWVQIKKKNYKNKCMQS